VTARPEFVSSTNGHGPQEGAVTGVATLLRAEPVVTAQEQIPAAIEQLPMPVTAQEPSSARFAFGWVASIVLCTAAGLGVLAVADDVSRHANTAIPKYLVFWLGMLLIFVPIALRALARDVNPLERLSLVVCLGLALYLVKVLASPYTFTFVDEYVHVRNTHEMMSMHHLFTWNPLLETAAYYPGLAALTAGVVALTGLSMFAAGLLIIGVARVILCAFFYLIFESVTHSHRAAAAASLIYMCNPMFLFWSSTFTYENLGLPLGAFVIWWIGRTRNRGGPVSMVVVVVSIIAVTITHHIVGFAMSGLLVAWWLAERVGCGATKAARRRVGVLALVASCATLVWFFGVARPAPTYLLTHNLFPALRDTFSVLSGHTAPRKLYAINKDFVPPAWEPVAGFAATLVLLGALPAGLLRARWFYRRAPLAVAMALAIAYPITLASRLSMQGAALSGRSSEFVYTGVGCVIGMLFIPAASRWRRRRASARGEGDGHRQENGVRRRSTSTGKALRDKFIPASIVVALATVVFVGNVTVGTRFFERLPEEANPHRYERSLQPDVIAASVWALHHLGPNQMFSANFIDSWALATDGEQDLANPPLVWPIFFAESVNRDVVQRIKDLRLRYLLVNWRMTRGLPQSPDLYIDPLEPEAGHYVHKFPARALEKFAVNPCIRLLYDAGAIQIYDLSKIENGTCS